jgi:hypothetical protein
MRTAFSEEKAAKRLLILLDRGLVTPVAHDAKSFFGSFFAKKERRSCAACRAGRLPHD